MSTHVSANHKVLVSGKDFQYDNEDGDSNHNYGNGDHGTDYDDCNAADDDKKFVPCCGLKPSSLPPESDRFKSEPTILTRPVQVQTEKFIKLKWIKTRQQ